MFEDGIGGDALDAVVTDLASDISQGSGPRVGWFDGLARFTQAVKPVNLWAFHLALDYVLVALAVEQDAPSRGLRCRASRQAGAFVT